MLIWVDWVIVIILLVSSVLSLGRGFVREALSLVNWVTAAIIAMTYRDDLATAFTSYISTPSLRLMAASALLFVVTMIVGGMIIKLITKLVKLGGLGSTDRLLGMIFGALRGVLMITIIVGIADYLPVDQDQWWSASVLIPKFQEFAVTLKQWTVDTVLPLFGSQQPQ